MKTNIHFWSYLARFFLEWKLVETVLLEKIKTNVLWSITFSKIPHRLWDNVGKHCRAEQVTDDNTIQRMRIACWITKVRDTLRTYTKFYLNGSFT